MLTDADLGKITIEFLGLDHMGATIARHREERCIRGPRDRGPMLNSLARDYCAMRGAFVDEMFEESMTHARRLPMPEPISKPNGMVLTDAIFTMIAARPGSKAFNEAYLPPATEEPSDAVKSSQYLMELLRLGWTRGRLSGAHAAPNA